MQLYYISRWISIEWIITTIVLHLKMNIYIMNNALGSSEMSSPGSSSRRRGRQHKSSRAHPRFRYHPMYTYSPLLLGNWLRMIFIIIWVSPRQSRSLYISKSLPGELKFSTKKLQKHWRIMNIVCVGGGGVCLGDLFPDGNWIIASGNQIVHPWTLFSNAWFPLI